MFNDKDRSLFCTVKQVLTSFVRQVLIPIPFKTKPFYTKSSKTKREAKDKYLLKRNAKLNIVC